MRRASLGLAAVVGAVATGGSVGGDVVLQWNDLTLDAVRFNHQHARPPVAARLMAKVHVTIHDVVNAFGGQYETYLSVPPPPPGASIEAAIASAAHKILVHSYPGMDWYYDPALQQTLDGIPDGQAKDDGIAFGLLCAQAVIDLREDDGMTDVVPYEPTPGPGNWVPTYPGFIPPWYPQWPYVMPWAMTHGAQFRVDPPPTVDSQEYTDAFFEVKELGRYDSATRTQDQTDTAWFWDDGPGTSTPPGHWNNIARTIAAERNQTLAQNARMLALLNITLADAAIVSWDNKYHHDHWRPITGIWEADNDGNPATTPDPDWLPLIITPPFQAYTSGHSTFSGSAAEVLALIFGEDEIAFCDITEGLPGQVERCYSSLSEAAEEAGMSRIYGGIHWQYDNIFALSSGRELGQFVFANYLRRLGDLNGDGVVDVSDLLILLGAWGPCPRSLDCPADLNNDGVVDVSDLLILLGNWGG